MNIYSSGSGKPFSVSIHLTSFFKYSHVTIRFWQMSALITLTVTVIESMTTSEHSLRHSFKRWPPSWHTRLCTKDLFEMLRHEVVTTSGSWQSLRSLVVVFNE